MLAIIHYIPKEPATAQTSAMCCFCFYPLLFASPLARVVLYIIPHEGTGSSNARMIFSEKQMLTGLLCFSYEGGGGLGREGGPGRKG